MTDLTALTATTTPLVTDIGYTVVDPTVTKLPRKVTWGDVANLFRTIAETLTGKSISLATNTITGTAAEFNTACSDDNFVYSSAGVIVSGGALGTPSSGTLTNCTELPLAGLAISAKTESFIISLSDETTVLGVASTTVPLATFRMPYAFVVTAVRASLRTAGTGAALITVDIHESGTSIMTTTKITIDATETTSTTAVTAPVLTDTALADDSLIELFLDLRDTDNVAKGLKVEIIGYQS